MQTDITRRVGEYWELLEYDAIVKLHFLPTEEGGRRRHTYSGYRPDMMMLKDISQTLPFQTNVGLYFIDKCFVYPNDTVYAELKAVYFEHPRIIEYTKSFFKNQEFLLLEGRKTIARGKIIEIPHR